MVSIMVVGFFFFAISASRAPVNHSRNPFDQTIAPPCDSAREKSVKRVGNGLRCF